MPASSQVFAWDKVRLCKLSYPGYFVNMTIFGLVFFCLFLLFSWKYFRWAVFLYAALLPAYLLRFDVGPLPSTILEMAFGALFIVWIIRYLKIDRSRISLFIKKHIWLSVFIAVFFISSVISVFASDMVLKSLGQWRAYFLEPLLLFVMLIGRRDEIKPKELSWALIFSSLSITVYSIVQKFTGWGIATAEWTNEATRRVTAFYTSPNAVGLYLGPVFILLSGLVYVRFFSKKGPGRVLDVLDPHFQKNNPTLNWLLGILIIITAAAIYFTKSQGAWIAVAAGLVMFVYLVGHKKLAGWLVAAGVVAVLLIPSMRSAVTFEKKSDQNRLTLWAYSWSYLKSSPQNFVFGTGIRQFFRKIQKPYYNDQEMERLIYPHNIFLNFWTETGLFGMLSFVGILGAAFWTAWKIKYMDKIFGACLLAVLITVLVHGLVDVPYFKNDLAMYFWILMAVIFGYAENLRQS
jgi:O-antigen ligase